MVLETFCMLSLQKIQYNNLKLTVTETLQDKVKTARQDLFFLGLFPILFGIFNICYWSVFIQAKTSQVNILHISSNLVNSTSIQYNRTSLLQPQRIPLSLLGQYSQQIVSKIMGNRIFNSDGATTMCTCPEE